MSRPRVILCNGAKLPPNLVKVDRNPIPLEYREERNPNIQISLPKLIYQLNYIPNRIRDLLEIAGYVFCADRSVGRGQKKALENRSWARTLYFVIKVREKDFWDSPSVKEKLNEALCFMTGDRQYNFIFQGGHKTSPSFFDREDFAIEFKENSRIILFSGGLDSMAGAFESLQNANTELCLVSHQSGQPSTIKTQGKLVSSLKKRYGVERIKHYKFHCKRRVAQMGRAPEETQRSRSFLYTSIAFALADRLPHQRKNFFVYENGITSLNFRRQQDAINARTSRTTHPKTIALLEALFSEIGGYPVRIEMPFRWNTKTDVFRKLGELGGQDLISSTVSCSRTFQTEGGATHCGGCFQCIDRRFAAYAANLESHDQSGIYYRDFVRDNLNDIENEDRRSEMKNTLLGYVRQARDFAKWTIDKFYAEKPDELGDIVECLPQIGEAEAVEKIYNLCHRHGQQIENAMVRMREVNEDLFDKIPKGSFLEIISKREHLKRPVEQAAKALCVSLTRSIPLAFPKDTLPKDERDLNNHIEALLSQEEFEREFPVVSFATSQAKPDHSRENLWIESKYLRGKTTPSVITEAIAADLTKYADWSQVLFVIFDPYRSIRNDEKFKKDFEEKGRCTVCIVR